MTSSSTLLKITRTLWFGFAICIVGACEQKPAPPSGAAQAPSDVEEAAAGEWVCRNRMACLDVYGPAWIETLHVRSGGLTAKSPITLCDPETCEEAMRWEFDGTGHRLFLRSARNGATNSQPAMVIEQHMSEDTPSRIGIGVPPAHDITHALEVNGTILAEEVLVRPQVADYVFDSQYDLMSLDDLEEFITAHHYLPGILPASALAEGDVKVSIGDSYRAILEKVEELTLHIIAQNKRIAALEKRLVVQRRANQLHGEAH